MILDKKNRSEEDRIRIINRGGRVMSDNKNEKNNSKIFSLRMPNDMSHDIDLALENTVGINKTGFILQCIHEKLKKG